MMLSAVKLCWRLQKHFIFLDTVKVCPHMVKKVASTLLDMVCYVWLGLETVEMVSINDHL